MDPFFLFNPYPIYEPTGERCFPPAGMPETLEFLVVSPLDLDLIARMTLLGVGHDRHDHLV